MTKVTTPKSSIIKRRFVIILLTIFCLAATGSIVIQWIQMQRSMAMSDNLFTISVNSTMEEVIDQLNRLKFEDYISQNDRYKLLKYKRVEELNQKMLDIVRRHSDVLYNEKLVSFGTSLKDSAIILQPRELTDDQNYEIGKYNTYLASKNRLLGDKEYYDKFVNDISMFIVNSIMDEKTFNYQLLDSLINDKLNLHGIDIKPDIAVYNSGKKNLLYCNNTAHESQILESPYSYSFDLNGLSAGNEFYILLYFPTSALMLRENSTIYYALSVFLIALTIILFSMSVKTIFTQRKVDLMKTDFISNITHEVKTPIATIGLACEMLRDPTTQNSPNSMKTYVDIINDENQRLKLLVETILQNAKMSNKNFKLNYSEVDIHHEIETVLNSFKMAIKSKNGIVETDLRANPSIVMCDKIHMTNMIYNLIDNALKYSTTEVYIKVSTLIENNRFIMKVEDHGIGISKEDQGHIFEKFYRVSTGDVHDVKGFGIGLNYVMQVMKAHKGTIGLQSELGKGSTFIISLPLI